MFSLSSRSKLSREDASDPANLSSSSLKEGRGGGTGEEERAQGVYRVVIGQDLLLSSTPRIERSVDSPTESRQETIHMQMTHGPLLVSTRPVEGTKPFCFFSFSTARMHTKLPLPVA